MNDSLFFIRVEQQSPNDEWYEVKELIVESGALVKASQVIATLEGSKTAFDVEAQQSGYFFTTVVVGEKLAPSELLGVVSGSPDFDISRISSPRNATRSDVENNADIDLRFSLAAKALLETYSLSPSQFAHLDYVTAADVRSALGPSSDRSAEEVFSIGSSIERVAVIGSGRGAVQVLDALMGSKKQRIVAYFDDVNSGADHAIFGVPVRGKIDIDLIVSSWRSGLFDKCVISISSNVDFRAQTYEKLKAYNIPFANIIHSTASFGLDSVIGDGNVVLANCTIGAMARIGCNNFVSAGCNIEHHCVLGNHNTFGPAVITSGNVEIGSGTRFGSGIFIEPKLVIGSNCVVSSGSVITKSVPDDTVVVYKTPLVFRKR